MKKIFFLHILSKNGRQTICTSDSENNKKLQKLQTEGWLLQGTKEYTDIKLAYTQKRILEQTLDINGREVV